MALNKRFEGPEDVTGALGAPADTAVTNPATDASIIAALKGLLSVLQNLTVDLDTSDLQIGAVELKDATTDNRLAINTNGSAQVHGGIASGATDSGNPVKAGGVYNSTKPTFTNGQRGDLQVGSRGALAVQIQGADSTGQVAVATSNAVAKAFASSVNALTFPQRFNGSTYDPEAGNQDATVRASAALAAASYTSADQVNYNGRGVKVFLDITAVTTSTLTLTIEGKDPVSGKYVTLLAGAAEPGTGTKVYTVYPGAAVSANVSANDLLPRTWRVSVAKGDSSSWTFSVGASVIV